MRINKQLSEKRNNFVLELIKSNPDITVKEIQEKLKDRWDMVMSPANIGKLRKQISNKPDSPSTIRLDPSERELEAVRETSTEDESNPTQPERLSVEENPVTGSVKIFDTKGELVTESY